MRSTLLNAPCFGVVYEDDALMVVNKRASVASMGVDAKTPDVLSDVRSHLSREKQQPFVGIVGRLDFPVCGLLVVAKTPYVARQLVKQRDSRSMSKCYHAVVSGRPHHESDVLTHALLKSKRHRRVSIVPPDTKHAQTARLSYRVVRLGSRTSLLRVVLHTGRKHQIRAQLGHLGHAILGDLKYGSKHAFPQGIALICKQIQLTHPTNNRRLSWQTTYPPCWAKALFEGSGC